MGLRIRSLLSNGEDLRDDMGAVGGHFSREDAVCGKRQQRGWAHDTRLASDEARVDARFGQEQLRFQVLRESALSRVSKAASRRSAAGDRVLRGLTGILLRGTTGGGGGEKKEENGGSHVHVS